MSYIDIATLNEIHQSSRNSLKFQGNLTFRTDLPYYVGFDHFRSCFQDYLHPLSPATNHLKAPGFTISIQKTGIKRSLLSTVFYIQGASLHKITKFIVKGDFNVKYRTLQPLEIVRFIKSSP